MNLPFGLGVLAIKHYEWAPDPPGYQRYRYLEWQRRTPDYSYLAAFAPLLRHREGWRIGVDRAPDYRQINIGPFILRKDLRVPERGDQP